MLVEGNRLMFHLADVRFREHNFGGNLGGIHAIATGMHYSPTELSEVIWKGFEDKESLGKQWAQCIKNLNIRKNNWEHTAKKSEKTYDFLKRNIYD